MTQGETAPADQLVRLDTGRSSLLVGLRGPRVPRLVHWGPRLPDGIDVATLTGALRAPRLASVPDPPPLADEPPALSLVPEHGFGFFGQPALLGSRDGRDFVTAFAPDVVEQAPGALTFRLEDEVAKLGLRLELTLDPDSDLLRARTSLTNRGDAPYDVQWLAALALTLPETFNETATLTGRWAGEFQLVRNPLVQHGQFERIGRYGRTGHASSPTVVIGEQGFGEQTGRALGLHLGWSGNHRLLVELRRDGSRQVQIGEWLLPGEARLEPGATLETPWVFGAWSNHGLNGISQGFHHYLRQTLLPRGVAEKPRPASINTWEAVYFDHDVATLKSIASAAAELGIERFVLDDGWFGRRNDASTSLGDWEVDARKYPDGLGSLIDHIQSLDMKFGLWVEPEMVNPESELYSVHPDWCLHLDGRTRPTQRSQLVLDLTQPDVSTYLFERIDRLLRAHAITYLKWDHNRDLAPPASAGRPAARAQTQAFYALIDRVRQAHPEVEIESCAAGGARVDFGVMSRAERFWASDNNDAAERLKIQRGASLLFPLEVIGAHVGAVPSHQTGRVSSLGFRARTALFGHFGLELDPRALSERDASELKQHIATYKRFRGLLHGGRLWRFELGDPQALGQIVVAPDGSEALAQLARLDQAPFAHTPPVRLPGLDAAARYRVELVERWPEPAASHLANPAFWRAGPVVEGAMLGELGLRLPLAWPETVWLLHLERM